MRRRSAARRQKARPRTTHGRARQDCQLLAATTRARHRDPREPPTRTLRHTMLQGRRPRNITPERALRAAPRRALLRRCSDGVHRGAANQARRGAGAPSSSAPRCSRTAPHAFAVTLSEASLKSDADWASEAARWSSGPAGSTFFAERGNEVVGMAGAHVAGDACELVAVWTAPEARREGVTRRVVGAIEAWARDGGATELWTAVAEGNEIAAAVYERLGFEPTGLQRPIGSDGSRVEWRYKRDIQQQ